MALIKLKKGLYKPAKHKEAAEHIMIDTPDNARKSIRWLNKEWKEAKTRAKKRKLIQFANLARNRAKVMSENERISEKERREAAKVAKIYDEWLKKHKLEER